MGRRKPPPALPEPTAEERQRAGEAARAMRAAIADHSLMAQPQTMHVDYCRPRRAEWITTWANLPGLMRVNGRYRHARLPGWTYARHEIKAEMIPDLEALAAHGIRPTEVTSAA